MPWNSSLSRTIIKSTALVALLTLFSRILGFIRDAVIAALFGADPATDAFFVAFRIPNFLRRLFAEGSFSQAFVPVLMRYRDQGSPAARRAFLDQTAGALAVLAIGATAAGIVAAPGLVLLFAPGFARDAQLFDLSTEMVRITFPYLGFVTLTAFAAAILNTYGRFGIPAFAPALLNLTMLAAAIGFASRVERPIFALGWSVTLAGLLQLLLQLPALHRDGLLPRPRWGLANPEVRAILKQIGPAVVSTSVTQINVLLNTVMASFLAAGSVSWLYYSDRLVEFPAGLLGVAIGNVMLPHLAQSHTAADGRVFSATLDWALRLALVATVPATVGLILCAKPLLFTLFQYDRFAVADVEMTARSLATYAGGIAGFVAVRILLSGFAARHDYRTPFRFGLFAIALNLSCSGILAYLAAPSGWGHAALGFATSLAGLTNAALLLRALIRSGAYRPPRDWNLLLLRTVAACAVMGALLAWLDPGPDAWRDWHAAERLKHLALLIGAGAAAYGASLWGTGLRPRHLQFHRPA